MRLDPKIAALRPLHHRVAVVAIEQHERIFAFACDARKERLDHHALAATQRPGFRRRRESGAFQSPTPIPAASRPARRSRSARRAAARSASLERIDLDASRPSERPWRPAPSDRPCRCSSAARRAGSRRRASPPRAGRATRATRHIAGDSPRRPAAGPGRSPTGRRVVVHGTASTSHPALAKRRGLGVERPVPRLRIVRIGNQEGEPHCLAGEQDSRLGGDLRKHRRADRPFVARPPDEVAELVEPRADDARSSPRRRRPGPCRAGAARKSIRSCSKSRARPAVSSRSHWSAGTKRATCCCAQSMPSAFAEPGVGAWPVQARPIFLRAASAAIPNTPSSSNRRTRPRTMSSLAPSEISRSRRAAASLRTSERISLPAAAEILRTPGSSSLHERADAGLAARRPQDVGQMRADAARGDREQLDADHFRQGRRLDLCPQFRKVEQALGDEEGGDHLRAATRPLLRSGRARRSGRAG